MHKNLQIVSNIFVVSTKMHTMLEIRAVFSRCALAYVVLVHGLSFSSRSEYILTGIYERRNFALMLKS